MPGLIGQNRGDQAPLQRRREAVKCLGIAVVEARGESQHASDAGLAADRWVGHSSPRSLPSSRSHHPFGRTIRYSRAPTPVPMGLPPTVTPGPSAPDLPTLKLKRALTASPESVAKDARGRTPPKRGPASIFGTLTMLCRRRRDICPVCLPCCCANRFIRVACSCRCRCCGS